MPIENTKNDAFKKYQNTYYKKFLTVTQGCQMLFLDLLLRPGGPSTFLFLLSTTIFRDNPGNGFLRKVKPKRDNSFMYAIF